MLGIHIVVIILIIIHFFSNSNTQNNRQQDNKIQRKMLYENEPDQIIQKLLSDSSPTKLLKQNDKMLLTWNKSQLLRKWPRGIIPIEQNAEVAAHNFTGMITTTRQKAYLYEDMMKPVEYNFVQNVLTQKHQQEDDEQFKMKQQKGDNQISNTQIHQGNAEQKQSKLIQKSSIKSEPAHAKKQQFSPFLPNYDNPFDRNANAKALKQKFQRIQLDSKKRNIAALVQNSKNNSQLKQHVKFGKSVPKRAADSIDISDILKYTLGIKRQKDQGMKPEPIRNPFVRVPPKYYESLGDFYGGTN